jgi:hypothetical protein
MKTIATIVGVSFLICAALILLCDLEHLIGKRLALDPDASRFNRKLGRVLDLGFKAFVVCAALYFLIEFAWAFRPGGAVERVLGGIR